MTIEYNIISEMDPMGSYCNKKVVFFNMFYE